MIPASMAWCRSPMRAACSVRSLTTLARGDADLGREQALDLFPPEQQRRAHGNSFIGALTARQPECPLFMYFASNPASRSLIAVLQPTWKP